MRKALSYIVPALILFSVLGIQYNFPNEIESVRAKFVFDVYQMIKPRVYQETPVRIIDIDDESLAKLGQWPWPRTLLAKLIARLVSGDAAAIAFDGVFPEPDRSSPRNMLPLWEEGTTNGLLRAQLEMIPDHDEVFAKVIAQSPVVLAFGLTNASNEKAPALKSGFLEHGTGNDKAVDYLEPVYKGAVVNLPGLEKVARGNGCFNTGMEWDNIVRRVPSFYNLNNSLYPSLALEAMRVFQGASTYKVTLAGATGEASFGKKSGIVGIKCGLLDIPTDAFGRVWLYDTGYKSKRFIPAWKILSDDNLLKEVKEKVLFIGASATALRDMRATPLDPFAAGVEVHAQIVEQMFLREYRMRPDWAFGVENVDLAFWGLMLIRILPRAGAIRCAVVAIVAIGAAIGFSWYLFTEQHLLIDPLFPSLAIFLIYLTSSFLNFLATERERSHIRGAFSRYLSPIMVEKLAKDPKQLKLGGEMRVMTFLFTDIRNFTGIAEQMKPEELTQFMNRFLTPMTDIILKHGGTIDKYMGDCIMAFWNAPLDNKDHAPQACLAALDMQSLIRSWNRESETSGRPSPKLQIGIGINTGNACVGNMGSEQRFDYTVLGDHVNLASRLEGLSKNYGITTVVGQNTIAAAEGFAALEIDLIRVKGKTEPVKIFALLGDAALEKQAIFRELRGHFEKMLLCYRVQEWDEADEALDRCCGIKLPGIDLGVLYELYGSRILFYRKNPPALSWDGVTVAASK